MTHIATEVISLDGTKLLAQSWTTDASIADLILIHGYTEHSGRYQWVAKKFNENGINVHSFDLRGYGQSDGERAYIISFDQYLEDVQSFIKDLEFEGDVFMLGHSMGGLIVSRYLIEHPETKCNGVILSGPGLKVGDDISPFLVKISAVLSALFPKLKTTRLDSQFISRDPKVVDDYDNDPLVYHDGVKSRLGGEMIKSMLEVRNHFREFNFPVLIMHGAADKLADPQGSQWMFDEISSQDKTIDMLPGLYHEILNEPEKEEVIGKMVGWIKERV